MSSSTNKWLITLLFLLTNNSPSKTQTLNESNDPNNLCRNSYTGYKATLDCRGYVYCNAGYLMGGDVIPCWPNQLFDEVNAVCTNWQSVTESLGGDIGSKCPEFDGSLMLPDDKDGNANPQLFFCGSSTFNAKSVCEPCPGGIKTECSDPSHNCYAGITGCPISSQPAQLVSSNPPPSTSGSPPSVVSIAMPTNIPKPTPNPTPRPTPQPTNPLEVSVEIDISMTAPAESIEEDRTDTFYLHGKLRESYYCGYSWDLLIRTCNMAHPCPSGFNTECPMGQTCFPDTPCHDQQSPPSTPNPTNKPTKVLEAKNYCGLSWDWVVNNCAQAIPCPLGDAVGVCPSGHKCIANTPCDQFDIVSSNSAPPTSRPTRHPTFPPVKGDDPNNRFCGHSWSDVTENCLTAVPCPGGVALGVCPEGMNCIAETPCTDEEYLDWLRDKHTKVVAEAVENEALKGNEYCMDDDDCNTGLLCNRGICGQCLDDGTGCSMEQICKPAACGEVQVPGPMQCFTASDMDEACRIKLDNTKAVCDFDEMGCEIPAEKNEQSQNEETLVLDSSNSIPYGESKYENPDGNSFFCGDDYYAILSICLRSKPCPGGFASGICSPNEGCFSVKACVSEYEAAASDAINEPPPITANPTRIPTLLPTAAIPSSKPTSESTSEPTVSEPTASEPTPITSSSIDVSNENTISLSPTLHPISSAPNGSNKNYCGVSWSLHTEDCKNATPCPRGDECGTGETCFNDSPCAALLSDTPAASTNINHLCGTDWNTLVNDCEDATPCLTGDEWQVCEPGQICYRNFECNPPQITVNGEGLVSEAPIESDSTLAGLTEYCNLCGSSGEFNYNGEVAYETFDTINAMPCGELIWIYAKNDIYDGSSECLAHRSKYFDNCCYATPQNACNICPPDRAIYLDKTTAFLGSQHDCSRVAQHFSSKYEMSSEECKNGKFNHAFDCCFTPCTMCGNMQPDRQASVYFAGADRKCNEFDIMFREESVTIDNARCQMSRDLYSDECCLESSVADSSPTSAPAPSEDVLSASWYAGGLGRTSEATINSMKWGNSLLFLPLLLMRIVII